jgi:hypothetical protein
MLSNYIKLFPIFKILLAYKHQHVCFKLNMRIRKQIRNEDVHIYKMHKCYKKNPKLDQN